MQYYGELILGFGRAAFWSGGWYWRTPLLVGLLPPFREKVQPMLEAVGLGETPSWGFYVFAALALALVVSARLAIHETNKIKLLHLTRHHGQGNDFIRVLIKNVSTNDTSNLRALLVRFRRGNLQLLPRGIDFPMVLPTQQRLQAFMSGAGPIPRERFSLASLEEKNVELFIPDQIQILINHENGQQRIIVDDYILDFSITGFGQPLKFSVRVFQQERDIGFYLIKDSLDELIMEQLSLSEWIGNGTRAQ